MIPRTAIESTPAVPPGYSFWTPRRDDLSDEGFGYFVGTWLIRGTWVRDARAAATAEEAIVAAVDALAANAEQFDRIAHELETCDVSELPAELAGSAAIQAVEPYLMVDGEESALGGLEIGVAGLVHALSATGCWPAASCRGHPGGWAPHPVVYLAADRHRVTTLRDLAEAAGCGFTTDPSRDRLLVVEAGSVEDTMRLGRLVMDARRDMVPRRGPRRSHHAKVQQLGLDFGPGTTA